MRMKFSFTIELLAKTQSNRSRALPIAVPDYFLIDTVKFSYSTGLRHHSIVL